MRALITLIATGSILERLYLYFMVNQLPRMARFQEGRDLRQPPYALFRVKIDAQPVQLAPQTQ